MKDNLEGRLYYFMVRAQFSANKNAFIALAIQGKELSSLFYTRRINWATRNSRKSPDLGCLFSLTYRSLCLHASCSCLLMDSLRCR